MLATATATAIDVGLILGASLLMSYVVAVVSERRQRERNRLAARQWVPTAAELPGGWR